MRDSAKFNDVDPKSAEGEMTLKDRFITQSAPDTCRKLRKQAFGPNQSLKNCYSWHKWYIMVENMRRKRRGKKKKSHGGFLCFKERSFFNSANTVSNHNHMRCRFLIWWHLTILRWPDVTMYIIWLSILIMSWLGLVTTLPYICNCKMGFVSNHLKAFRLQMVVQAPTSATTSSNYYLGPQDQRPSIWGLGEYAASTI